MRKYDELNRPNSCIARAEANEMMFVLLARDPAAPFAIRAWIAERCRLGKNTYFDEQMNEARKCAETMERERQDAVSA